MGGGAADDGQLRVVPFLEPILQHRRQEMASLPIPDELLAEILLRLPTTADLACASAACVSFRRVAADRPFLRWYRKLHAAPLLGFLDHGRDVFHPAVPPHPSASAARAVALAADFSFSFLPAPASDWIVRDIRDGRVLLDRAPPHDLYKVVFPELVVSDPLYRRHLLLPPIPAHLAATVEDPIWMSQHRYCETFLAPRGDGEEEASAAEETSFNVVWMTQCTHNPVAFVFSSSTGQWRAIPSQSWSDLFAGLLSSEELSQFTCRKYAYGCFYWVRDCWLLVLDTQKMEFSIAEIPPEAEGLNIAIVEAGQGRIGMFVRPLYANYVNYIIRINNCGSSSQWQFEKKISLDSRYLLMGSMGRHLILYQYRSPSVDPGCFLLDVKTFQIERVFVSNPCTPALYAYSNFPPSLLSTPTVSGGKL